MRVNDCWTSKQKAIVKLSGYYGLLRHCSGKRTGFTKVTLCTGIKIEKADKTGMKPGNKELDILKVVPVGSEVIW